MSAYVTLGAYVVGFFTAEAAEARHIFSRRGAEDAEMLCVKRTQREALAGLAVFYCTQRREGCKDAG